MEFTVEKNLIATPLQHAAGFTTNKNLSNILQNVYIEANAEKGEITIKATNFQIGFTSTIKADVKIGGAITVTAEMSKNIASLPDGETIFKCEKDQFFVSQGDIEFKFPTLDPNLYPKNPVITPEYTFRINGKLLVDLFKRVIFCVSSDTARIEYNGVHLSIFVDHIEISSSDTQRIANTKTKLDESVRDEFSVNIPKLTVSDVIKIFEDEPSLVIETDKRHIAFIGEHTIVTSKLIEKTVTRITRLIYEQFSIKAVMNKANLYEALKRVSTAAGETTYGVRFNFNDTILELTSIDSEREGRDKTIKDVEISVKEYSIIFNSKHLLEIISNIKAEKVVFNFNNNDKPVLIYPEDESAKYVMVPIVTDKYL
jgi:DNA polymerase-3 subunit beta